jgi:lipopolysaccharide export system protein LptA
MRRAHPAISCALVLAALALAVPAAAQAPGAPKAKAAPAATGFPNALQGFQRNRRDPVKIEANALEVRDKDKTAVFSGNVLVQQGDTQMRCKELTVHYNAEALPAQPASTQAVAPQQIRKLVASGGVIITSKDQRATGNVGIYDTRANTVTLSGNVVVVQGPNVLRGDKLIVDLTSGLSRLEAEGKATAPGRVHGLFVPGSVKEPPPVPEEPSPAGRPPRTLPLPQRQ